jgi:hypothetical protein
MGMVLIVNAAGVGKDLGLNPFPNLSGWGQADAEAG